MADQLGSVLEPVGEPRLPQLNARKGAVIVEGESITHARVLAVANELGRATQFDDGYAIDPDLAEMIPEDFIWRKLSPKEASDLLNKLREGPPRHGHHTQPAILAKSWLITP